MRAPGAPARRRRAAAAMVAYMINSAWASELPAGAFADRTKLKEAVDEWVLDDAAAAKKYGPISGWDASRVDDLSNLFGSKTTFNGAVGGWDTSRVTTMEYTFYDAKAFNQALDWDTSSVTNMYGTFRSLPNNYPIFDQPLAWDTSKVTTLSETFYMAEAFNSELVWDCLLYTSPSPRDS